MDRSGPAAYPKIRGLVWFEGYDDGMDCPLESSLTASTGVPVGIANPLYVANSSNLNTTPVPAPTADPR